MKILVFGAGAIGSVFGGFLSMRNRVSLLGRPWHIGEIRRDGLRIKGIWGQHLFKDFGLYTDVSELVKEKDAFDIILLTVKAKDTTMAAKEIKKVARKNSVIISLQNGLGNVETLLRHFPAGKILAGRVIFGAEITPGTVNVSVCAGDVLIGEISKKRDIARAEKIAEEFTRCGIRSRAVKDIVKHIWLKVIYNCALNGLAALLDVPYGKLLLTKETKDLMKDVVGEIYRIARKKKINLNPKTPGGYVRLLFNKLIPLTSAHHPSTLQMIKMGKRTEIDYLNGAIGKLGRKLNVKTPVNDMITKLIKAKENLNLK